MAKKGSKRVRLEPRPFYLGKAEGIHLEPLCLNLKMEKGAKLHDGKDEEGRAFITVDAQFTANDTKRVKAKSAGHLLGSVGFSDKTAALSFVTAMMNFVEQHLAERMVQVGCSIVEEAIEYANEQALGRGIDKTELRKNIIQTETRHFNKRWRMPKNSNFECTREELIEKVRAAIFELDSVHKWRERGKRPVKEIVAEHLGYWDGAALSKVMAKRTILSWKVMLHLCGWHWLPENNRVRRFKN